MAPALTEVQSCITFNELVFHTSYPHLCEFGWFKVFACVLPASEAIADHSSIPWTNGWQAACSAGSQTGVLRLRCQYSVVVLFALYSVLEATESLLAKLNRWSRKEMVEVYSTQKRKLEVVEPFAISIVSLSFLLYCECKSDGAEVCRLSSPRGWLWRRWVHAWLASGRLHLAGRCTDLWTLWENVYAMKPKPSRLKACGTQNTLETHICTECSPYGLVGAKENGLLLSFLVISEKQLSFVRWFPVFVERC